MKELTVLNERRRAKLSFFFSGLKKRYFPGTMNGPRSKQRRERLHVYVWGGG